MLPVCVLGLGLIGGSVLRAASAAGRAVWGATASTADAEAATAAGFTVEASLDDALRRADEEDALVVLAVPLTALPEVLRSVAAFAPGCRLTDVTSVKGAVTEAVRKINPYARYVGGHPMAGTSRSGWASGSAELFRDAPWVVTTEDDSDQEVWAEVVQLALSCGAHVVPTSSAAHDDAVARISHLPHLLAAVLASVGASGGPLSLALAAGSFGDGTRVASSRPELVQAMCEGNRAALLDAVDDALGRLGAARGSLASTGGLAATVNAGHLARRELEQHRSGPRQAVKVDLTADNAMATLRDLGNRGGRLTSLDGTVAVVKTL
ncbi:prephenate dehydrogenase [Kutzneria viridogrisea]|uniref:Prephenate dehydrogenase n=1 Tax=Kutzneria viridogrisea TaxID=47990 RepID=A0ABR6BQ57_9PSEU|nr:prephenate dehydrogenase [Kutzneria albida]MBA8929027.1 prephenate dehydrogenase [Kutzneria viridogrisea]